MDRLRVWKRVIVRWLGVAVFALVLNMVGVVGSFWAIDRTPPLAVDTVYPIAPVKPGGILFLHWIVVRQRSCAYKVDREYQDAAGVRFPVPDAEGTGTTRPLGRDTFTIPIQISPAATPGPARYMSLASYYCNPIHYWFPIVAERVVVSFTID